MFFGRRVPVTISGSDFANNCEGPDYRFAKEGGGAATTFLRRRLKKKSCPFRHFHSSVSATLSAARLHRNPSLDVAAEDEAT